MNNMNENENNNNLKKTFKDYMKDPEYKLKHYQYMSSETQCDCGCVLLRANLSKHKKSKKHMTLMQEKEEYRPKKIINEIKFLDDDSLRLVLLGLTKHIENKLN